MKKYQNIIIKYATLDEGNDFAEQMVNAISFIINNFLIFGYTQKDKYVASRLNWVYLHIEESKPILDAIKFGADYKSQLEKLCDLILNESFIHNQNKKNNFKIKDSLLNSSAIF